MPRSGALLRGINTTLGQIPGLLINLRTAWLARLAMSGHVWTGSGNAQNARGRPWPPIHRCSMITAGGHLTCTTVEQHGINQVLAHPALQLVQPHLTPKLLACLTI